MKNIRKTLLKTLGSLCLSAAMLPAMALAQNRPQAGAGGGGVGGGTAVAGAMMQVMKELDLTADQKQNIQEIMKQAMQDASDAGTGMQDATPQEKMQKMQDVRKIVSDAKEKAEGVLTPEQKTKYYPLAAKALVAQLVDRVKALQTASAKMEIADDERGKLKTVFDDDLKTLDDCKTDADAVKDSQGLTDLQAKVTKIQMDTRKNLLEILGQDDLQQLMQNMRQATGGATARRGVNGLDAPTTKPAAK